MVKDNMALTGALTILINDKVVQKTNNLVVDSGKNWVASRMGAATSGVMSHMAIGTGTTAVTSVSTTLAVEVERNALTASGGTVSGNSVNYSSTFGTTDGAHTVTEAGLFNSVGNVVDDVNMTAAGTGYTSAPTVVFTGGFTGTTATGTANLTGTTVTSVTITGAGTGYTVAPTMTFTGGDGSGAAATATLKEGGTMLAKTVFASVEKQAADSMTISWDITVG